MNTDTLKKYEKSLQLKLRTSFNFLVYGDATDFIEKWANSENVEVLSMELHSIEDVRGERVIVTDAPTPYFFDRYWWLDTVKNNPNKKHLMIFYIEEADVRTVNALKSFLEKENDNLFYGLICRDPNKKINSNTTHLLGGGIEWGEIK